VETHKTGKDSITQSKNLDEERAGGNKKAVNLHPEVKVLAKVDNEKI
jgi:hypothetical protein